MTRKLKPRTLGVFIASVATAVVVAGLAASPAAAHGCTPGFFKNHTQYFTPSYPTTRTLGSTFPLVYPALANDTLLQALYYPGGPGMLGANQIFMRAAVAALLNANNTDIGTPGADFGMSTSYVLWFVNMMYTESNYRSALIAGGALFDEYNNDGACQLVQ
jgi:hypothetical protein